MEQKTPTELRADAEKSLRPLGERRIRLLAELDAIDAELRPLIVAARRVELPIRRITEITAVATGTVRAWTQQANQAEES